MEKKYMVKSMDNGRISRKYYKTENGARKYFNACGSAALFVYDEDTCCYEYVDAR